MNNDNLREEIKMIDKTDLREETTMIDKTDLREEKTMINKTNLRDELLTERNAMSNEKVSALSQEITTRFISYFFNEKIQLMTYVSMGKEADTTGLIEAAFELGISVSVPKTYTKGRMLFYEITSLDTLVQGRFQVMEPRDTDRVSVPNERTRMVIPGLAFDRKGNRIGYGSGYYDRYLQAFPDVQKIGLAYDFQVHEEIPVSHWDVPLDYIITESQIIKISS